MLKRYRLVIVNLILLMALGGSLYGKRIEMADVKRTNFLSSLQPKFRDWTYKETPLTSNELRLLDPDDSIARFYHPPKGITGNDDWAEAIQLVVIAGHRK